MPKPLIRINAAIEECEKHLLDSSATGTEIESYLTQYLLIILCAEVQQEIYKIVEERANRINDPNLATFVSLSSKKILRSVGKKEIAGFVELFGADCKAKLNAQIEESKVTLYNNAVANRHDVAHKQGSSFSFRELKDAVVAAELLLVATESALS